VISFAQRKEFDVDVLWLTPENRPALLETERLSPSTSTV
jgi:hypothetical protein